MQRYFIQELISKPFGTVRANVRDLTGAVLTTDLETAYDLRRILGIRADILEVPPFLLLTPHGLEFIPRS